MNIQELTERLQSYPNDMNVPNIHFNSVNDLLYFLDEQLHAKTAVAALPENLRKWYLVTYGTNEGRCNNFGEFLGLSCRCCNFLRAEGHDVDCPVASREEGGKNDI